MSELLIFGGTTEGRRLADICVKNGISADVSVATEYGASLLPDGVRILCGRLDAEQMTELMKKSPYRAVIDCTHPYAVEVTENIRIACLAAELPYLRLIRSSSDIRGTVAKDMEQLRELLGSSDRIVLSTLGSKAAAELAKVRDHRRRIWLRVLPSEDIRLLTEELGFDESRIIQEKGPFTVSRNIEHIKLSGAEILLTKESGETGGYPEKAEAAEKCGIELVTLARPSEKGFSFDETVRIIMEMRRERQI
ncbi:MAG: precorrin-6A reductase [Ruminococcus sp.]|nr:precorrin-6A reductase [Ruminococcus sp.]